MSVFSVMRMERDIIISMRVAMCRFFVRGMTVSVAPAVAMIMLVKECSTNDVECEASAAHDENQLGILDLLKRNKSLDGLEKDADTEGQEEDAVEKGTQQASALPAERELLGKVGAFRDLECQS